MKDYPLIKFVLFFICSILLQVILKIESSILFYLSIILFTITLVVVLFLKEGGLVLKNIFTILSIIFIGGFYYSVANVSKTIYPFENPKHKDAVIYGKIKNIELIKKDRLTMIIYTDSIYIKNEKFKNKINILYGIRDSNKKLREVYNEIGIGNSVVITGTLIKPRDKRNPGEFDYQNYLAEQQISAIANSYSITDLKITNFSTNLFDNAVVSIRKKIDELISKVHNKTTAGLLRGLLLADRSLIDYEARQEFVNAGVMHILAVSGLHVGFIVLIFLFLFQRFNIYARYFLTIIGLTLFMIITGSPPSVTRATIMAVALLISPVTGRAYNSYNALALAALIILIINPNELFNPGFQLSFSAVLSIVVFYPPLSNHIKTWKVKSRTVNYILLFSITSISAQIGTLPFTLAYFEKLSLVSLITNLIVIPLAGCIVGLGIFTIILASIIPQAAILFASTNELLTYVLFNFVNISGRNYFSYIPIYNFSLYDALIFYLTIGFLFVVWKKIQNITAKIVAISLSIIFLFLFSKFDDYELLPENKLSIMALDIGQGDSFLIRFPSGSTALVDAGDATNNFDNGRRVILPLLNRFGIQKVDYGFVSHIDSDHYRGFLSLIEEKKISLIYKPVIDSSLERDLEFERLIKKNEISIKYYSKNLLSVGNVRLYILNDTTDTYFDKLSINDKSGILKLVYGNTSFLFTGDAGVKAEKYFVNKYGKFLKSNLLKAGHHGSKTSTSNLFLDIVDPDIALISAGIANKFKHPHPEIISRLKERDIIIHRTDECGAVLLQSDGENIENISWKRLESGFIF